MSRIESPDGLIDLNELEDTDLDDMWEKWPNTAFWIWDNREMVRNKPKRKSKKPWSIGDDYDYNNPYMCAYGGFWD